MRCSFGDSGETSSIILKNPFLQHLLSLYLYINFTILIKHCWLFLELFSQSCLFSSGFMMNDFWQQKRPTLVFVLQAGHGHCTWLSGPQKKIYLLNKHGTWASVKRTCPNGEHVAFIYSSFIWLLVNVCLYALCECLSYFLHFIIFKLSSFLGV